jgi:hypothetical protein
MRDGTSGKLGAEAAGKERERRCLPRGDPGLVPGSGGNENVLGKLELSPLCSSTPTGPENDPKFAFLLVWD